MRQRGLDPASTLRLWLFSAARVRATFPRLLCSLAQILTSPDVVIPFPLVRSCDGGSFSGESPAPLVGVCGANGPPALHFAGSRILNESIRYLTTQHGLTQAKEVVVGGCSAGGLAVFLHADRWAAALPSVPRVVGLVDSGFFLDTSDPESKSTVGAGSTYISEMQWVFETMNATDGIGQGHACISYYRSPASAPHQGETWRCIFAQHAAAFVKTPIFIMQSAYDAWQVCHGDGAAPCRPPTPHISEHEPSP